MYVIMYSMRFATMNGKFNVNFLKGADVTNLLNVF